jgi:predicted permease
MTLWRRLSAYVQALLRRRRIEREADEEFAFHLDMEIAAHRARGLSDAEARRTALREFGGVTQAREGVRAARTLGVASLWWDARYAMRLWRRHPVFTATAWLTLALGIGATTTIASVAYSLFLRPLPVHDEASLFVGYIGTDTTNTQTLSWPVLDAWRSTGVVDDLAAVTQTRTELTEGVAERIQVQQVTGNFFRVLGVHASLGRVLSEADDDASVTPAVISDALWRSRFAADPGVIGRQIPAGGFRVVIVGVLPPGVDRWRGVAHMWMPILGTVPTREMTRGYYLFTPVARVHPDRVPTAQERMLEVTHEIDGPRITNVRMVPLREDVSVPRLERIVLVLFAGVALTWLVVCANLSNLLLARGPARSPELTVRLAIGATRGRIVRQLLVESAMFVVPGGLVGVWLASLAVAALSAAGTVATLHTAELALHGPVVWFALLLTSASVVASGALPALTAGSASLARGIATDTGPASTLWARSLVVVQVAVGLTVLVAAALLVQSVSRVNDVPLGFDSQQVLTFRASLPISTYGTTTSIEDDRYLRPHRDLMTRLSAIPGVELGSFGGLIFLPGESRRSSLSFDDGRRYTNGEPKDIPFAPVMRFVGPQYFAVHGVPLLRGREFAFTDDFQAERVVVVNEAMAALHWSGQDPIGKRVNFGMFSPRHGLDEPWARIVGVVPDVRHGGVDVPVLPYVYRAATQYPRREFDVMLRTGVAPETLMSAVRAEVRAFDPTVPMFATRILADAVDEHTADVRHGSQLLVALALFTVVIAGAGVFSVLASVVAARRRDLAIRVALGAAPGTLARAVLRDAAFMILPGGMLGMVGALVAGGTLGSLLYEVDPADPVVFAGAATLVVVVGMLAAYAPARRAARVDPVVALKE